MEPAVLFNPDLAFFFFPSKLGEYMVYFECFFIFDVRQLGKWRRILEVADVADGCTYLGVLGAFGVAGAIVCIEISAGFR